MRTDKRIEVVINISDLHAGSCFAPIPDGFRTLEGNVIGPNSFQKFANAEYAAFIKRAKEKIAGRPYAVVHNGDAIQGIIRQDTQVWSWDLADHVAAAVELLKPLTVDAEKVFIVRGTAAHTGAASEPTIGAILGAERDVDGRGAFDVLHLNINGLPCVWTHHAPGSARPWTRATALGTILSAFQQEYVAADRTIPRLVCVAHRHVYGELRLAGGMCICTPAWQGLNRFGHKVVPHAVCALGANILDFGGKKKGEYPESETFLRFVKEPKWLSI